jgi:hypothetical protein
VFLTRLFLTLRIVFSTATAPIIAEKLWGVKSIASCARAGAFAPTAYGFYATQMDDLTSMTHCVIIAV